MKPITTESEPNREILGSSLSILREHAGLTQAQMAKKIRAKISVSPAGISRMEAGERAITAEELDAYLSALGTEEAQTFREFLAQEWTNLERPDFDHPDRDTLWRIQCALGEIVGCYSNPELKAAFRKQLEGYEHRLRHLASSLESRDHPVAVIGSIGVGKSTKLCRVTGLETNQKDAPIPRPVLEVGGGGITICEVHIKQGPDYGILVEPRTEDEIKADVADFCDYLIGSDGGSDGFAADADSLGVSKEVVRAIRNMSGLTVTKRRGEDGKTIRQDKAKELAKQLGDPRELLVQVLSQMELPRRDRRDVWYSKSSGKEPLEWLRATFTEINNGRHPDFSLPRRIEVVVPRPVLAEPGQFEGRYSVRLVDTKGIDQTAGRMSF